MLIAQEYNRYSLAASMKLVGEELCLVGRALAIGYSADVTREHSLELEKALVDLATLLKKTVDVNSYVIHWESGGVK